MQVELKEPETFEEAARFADRADNVLTRVSGQGTGGKSTWFKGNSYQGGGNAAKGHFQPKVSGGGPEPMEIGSIQKKPLSSEEKNYLWKNKGCFLCRKINAGHISKNCPLRKNGGKQGN